MGLRAFKYYTSTPFCHQQKDIKYRQKRRDKKNVVRDSVDTSHIS